MYRREASSIMLYLSLTISDLPRHSFCGKGSILVTAQVVLCLVCDVPTDGVWGQEQWAREAPAEPSCPLRPSKNKGCPPAGRRAEPYILFPGRDRAQRSEREPMPVLFFSHSNPMDKVHGGISIRFAVVLVCLPMLSPFHIGSPCGERESFQARILGSYKQRFIALPVVRVPRTTGRAEKKEAMGALPPNP